MRYVLMVVGFLAGTAALISRRSHTHVDYQDLYVAMFVAAAVFFAAGAATVDIVAQIKAGQKASGKDSAPTEAKAQQQDT